MLFRQPKYFGGDDKTETRRPRRSGRAAAEYRVGRSSALGSHHDWNDGTAC
jgi:hypothetical protein